jgi:hypothetical protein
MAKLVYESVESFFHGPTKRELSQKLSPDNLLKFFNSSYKTNMGRFKESNVFNDFAEMIGSDLDDIYLVDDNEDKWIKILDLVYDTDIEKEIESSSKRIKASDGVYIFSENHPVAVFKSSIVKRDRKYYHLYFNFNDLVQTLKNKHE